MRQLTFVGRRAGEGYFSPAGDRMVFQSEREPGNPFFQIYELDLESGESRRVSTGRGKSTCAFVRIRPNKNFGMDTGSGAWELGARVSQLDLNDTDITSALRGRQTNFTLGTNWYLNPNTRIMLNWVHADVDGVGDSDSIAMRFQVDF